MLYMIACVGENNEIGYANKLLWNIPKDMARFKEITMGDTIIMGRKTHESIGRDLPGRNNVVISKTVKHNNDNKVCHMCDLNDTILWAIKQSRIYNIGIIGGAEIYKAFIDYVNVVYLTKVFTTPKFASHYFPIDMHKEPGWKYTSDSLDTVNVQDITSSEIIENIKVEYSSFRRDL